MALIKKDFSGEINITDVYNVKSQPQKTFTQTAEEEGIKFASEKTQKLLNKYFGVPDSYFKDVSETKPSPSFTLNQMVELEELLKQIKSPNECFIRFANRLDKICIEDYKIECGKKDDTYNTSTIIKVDGNENQIHLKVVLDENNYEDYCKSVEKNSIPPEVIFLFDAITEKGLREINIAGLKRTKLSQYKEKGLWELSFALVGFQNKLFYDRLHPSLWPVLNLKFDIYNIAKNKVEDMHDFLLYAYNYGGNINSSEYEVYGSKKVSAETFLDLDLFCTDFIDCVTNIDYNCKISVDVELKQNGTSTKFGKNNLVKKPKSNLSVDFSMVYGSSVHRSPKFTMNIKV